MPQWSAFGDRPPLTVFQRLAALAAPLPAGLLACGALLAALGGPVPNALADGPVTYPGSAPCDTTLQACLDGTAPGSTIQVQPGTYTESLTLSTAISLTGVSSDTTFINALTDQRVLTVTGAAVDSSVVISGLTFAGGHAVGAACPAGCGGALLITNTAQPQLVNLTITNSVADAYGGGLYDDRSAAQVITGVAVLSNSAQAGGGGVYVAGDLTLAGGLFQDNQSAYAGGGLYAVGRLAANDTQFLHNLAQENGGGAWVSATATLNGGLFQDNQGVIGAGLLSHAGDLILTDTEFLSNTSVDGGAGAMTQFGNVAMSGGLFQDNQCTMPTCDGGGLVGNVVSLTGTQFISNTAHDQGGGLFGGSALITGGVFLNNSCNGANCLGGGLFVFTKLAVTNTQFLSNTSGSDGGAAVAGGLVALDTDVFQGNTCTGAGCRGGGLWADSLTATASQFLSNTSGSDGGGAWSQGTASVTGGVFQNNQSGQGGGLYANSFLTLSGTQFLRNTAAMTGGGAYAGDVLTLTTGLFQANQGHDGGGLYAASIAIVTATQFLNNASGGDGGGADVNGNSQIVNSLFAANQAGGHGQALYQNPSGVSYLFFDTVTSPTLGAGAAVYVVTGTTFLADSIVASYSVGLQNAGGGTLEGYNLFFAVPVTVTGNLFSAAHDVTGDPAFVDPSAGDYHLGPGSLAIDAGFGVGVATDFEGDPRPQGGGFDIGFDESPYTATADVGLTKTASAATLAPGETLTYTLQYTNAGPNVAAGVLLTDLVPANLTDLSYASSGAALAQVGPDSFAWQVDNLAPGAGGIVTLTGVLSGGLHGSVFTNTASISTAYSDTNLADNTSAVSVTVANVAPVAVADAASLGRNTTLTVTAPGVLANDTDGNGDPLTADLVAGPFTGTVDLRADGAFTYTPPFGFAGGVTFTYRASDRLADSNIVTVTLTVTNFAPVAVDDAYSLPADSPLTVTAPGLLANDTDANGDALTAALVAGPLTGTFGLQADGSFTYTPPLGYSGGVTFTYQANDGLALSNAATVTLTVGPPTANLGLVKAASASLLAPGGRLTYTLVYSNAGPDLATGVRLTDVVPANLINLSAASSGADITATAGLTDAWQVADLAPGAGGVITLTGVLSASPRGTVFTNTATISTAIADTNPANNTSAVRVTVANLAPLAVAEAYTLSANSTLTVTAPGLLANDTDGNHDPLTAVLAAGPLTGTLHLRADGSFSYTPPPGFSGEVTFTYRANDGLADSNTATVTITVTAVEHKLYLPLMRR